jgi:hypothetical protein
MFSGGRRPWWTAPPGAWPDSNGGVILGFRDAQYQRWALSRLAPKGTEISAARHASSTHSATAIPAARGVRLTP